MQSPTCFIAFPFGERRYDNTKIMGDVEVVTSTSEEITMLLIALL